MTDFGEDPRTAFLAALPRKLVEIKATLGALIADPRSSRMRDELRRRLHTLFTVARAHTLPALTDTIKTAVDLIDATRSAPQISAQDLDRVTLIISSFGRHADSDAVLDPESLIPGTEPIVRRSEVPRAPTLVSLVAPPPSAPMSPPVTATEGYAALRPSTRPPSNPSPGVVSMLPGRLSVPPANVALSGAISVIFAGSHARAASLRGLLPADVEIIPTVDFRDALARSRDSAPDAVIAEVDPPADGISLLQALRRDPLTDFIPVVLVASHDESVEALRIRCPDAADALSDTADAIAIRSALERALTGGVSLTNAAPDLGELTLDELTRALQDELRRGLVGAATPRARTARVAMGAGSEVLAATWEAIARIRNAVEKRSAGQVRFDQHAPPRGLPGTHVFSLDDDALHPDEITGEDPLPGRRALVVDDDLTVVGQFASLLRDAGMEVHERTDGAEALKAARRLRPDVVIADILMPGLDGFALCRAMRRDVALRHTPMILLSWKDDLLVRMREMGAQAQGYLRKEARGEAILARVRAVLRARVRVLRRVADLAVGAEARGRVERVGTYPLIETAAENLFDATVTVSDSTTVTDLEIREGALVSAVRTFQDGRMVRGNEALLQAVGAASGRFAVRRSTGAVRANLTGALADQLRETARRIAALEESVTGAALLDVLRVETDQDAVLAFARSLPVPMRALVDRLLAGDSPRDMVLRDGVAPSDLEPLLVDLARRGAIHAVTGMHGEDLVGLRLAALESSRPPPPHTLPPRAPVHPVAEPTAAITVPAPPESVQPWLPLGLEPSRPVPASFPPPNDEDDAAPVTLADAVWRELRENPDEDAWGSSLADREPPIQLPLRSPPPQVDLPSIPPDLAAVGPTPLPVVPPPPAVPTDMGERIPSDPSALLDLVSAVAFSAARPTEPAPDAIERASAVTEPAPAFTESEPVVAAAEAVVPEPTPVVPEPTPVVTDAPAHTSAAEPSDAAPPAAPPGTELPSMLIDDRPEHRRVRTRRPPQGPSDVRSEQGGLPTVLVGMLIAGLASFGVVRWWIGVHPTLPPEPDAVDAEVIEVPPREAVGHDGASVTTPALEHPRDASVRADASVAAAAIADSASSQGNEAPYSDPAPYLDGGAIPSGMGLLVVRAPHPGAASVEVQVDQRVLGNAPLLHWAGEGLHTIRYRAGVVTSYQFTTVHPGRAVVVSPPSDN